MISSLILGGAVVLRIVSKVLMFGPGLTLYMLSVPHRLDWVGHMVITIATQPTYSIFVTDTVIIRHSCIGHDLSSNTYFCKRNHINLQ